MAYRQTPSLPEGEGGRRRRPGGDLSMREIVAVNPHPARFARRPPPERGRYTALVSRPYNLPLAIAVFALVFLLPAWPWLSGAVTIPWDAKSQFFPQVQFLATSFARGEWPWWA